MVETRAGNENRDPNAVGAGPDTLLDMFLPVIPKPDDTSIKKQFKFPILTPIEGEPTYGQMKEVKWQLAQNALTVNASFGGGKHGVLALVLGDTEFLDEKGRRGSFRSRRDCSQTYPPMLTQSQKRRSFHNS